jgi:hypothetical protein
MINRAAYGQIISWQRGWALQRNIPFDANGYVHDLEANLFVPLCKDTESDFSKGRGDELGEAGGRGKMQALHSSSALAVNLFEYWRHTGQFNLIARVCGFKGNATGMRFEATHDTPIGSTPHLDLEFTSNDNRVLAVESKFTETYRYHTRRQIKEAYLKPGVWQGLPGCEWLAQQIFQEQEVKTSFAFLDAPQLLKHILALTHECGDKFELLYLWYYVPSTEAEEHKKELGEFKRRIDEIVCFRDMTYQELFSAIQNNTSLDPDYLTYIKERYFTE